MTILHILQHALGRNQYGEPSGDGGREDYRNHFCAGDGHADFVTCREAVARGLMLEYAPSAITGGDCLFVVTAAGKDYIASNSPSKPKRSRGQQRYRRFLDADSGLSFGEWLKMGAP